MQWVRIKKRESCMRRGFLAGLLCILGVCTWGQSADRITEILNSETVTYGQASYLAASYLGLVSEQATDSEAMEALIDNKLVKAKYMGSEETPIPLANFCNICCGTWYIVDSISYSIFKNPYYAWKEMKAFKYIPSGYTSQKTLSGYEVLNIVTRCIEHHERDSYERKIRAAIDEQEQQIEKFK